ncbi:MAG TPA: hypothetical protein VI456_16965, partial [Polyangia bacterium]
MRRALVVGLVAISGWGAGCSGSSGQTCGGVNPCGGDVVGSWSIVDSCLSANGMFSSQKQAFFAQFCTGSGTGSVSDDVADASWVGAWSFDASMSYAVSILETVHESFTCSDGETCAALDTEIKSAQATTPIIQSAGCQQVGGACQCTVDWATFDDESGTYSAAGTAISLAPTTGAATSQIGFCVKGDTMHW